MQHTPLSPTFFSLAEKHLRMLAGSTDHRFIFHSALKVNTLQGLSQLQRNRRESWAEWRTVFSMLATGWGGKGGQEPFCYHTSPNVHVVLGCIKMTQWTCQSRLENMILCWQLCNHACRVLTNCSVPFELEFNLIKSLHPIETHALLTWILK